LRLQPDNELTVIIHYVAQLKKHTIKQMVLNEILIQQTVITHYVPQLKKYTDKPTALTDIPIQQ